ncbi:MAG: Yip1 family protein [Chloroflexota bacterium]|nr:Yip1 family protein [Chloroflexota bacterium]
MKRLIRLAWEALFLSKEPYAEMHDDSNPMLHGLALVILIALVVTLAGLVGTTLEWATTPNMHQVQQIILDGIQKMPWYQELHSNPEFRDTFRQQYEWVWRIIPAVFDVPNITQAAMNIILMPLGLGFTWLLYGVVAYLFARLMGGQGSLGQTLGCTALAIAPQLLNLITLLPYVAVGGVVGAWTLLCRYVALKTCHRLTWNRALAATLLPYVAFLVLASFIACLGGAAATLIFGGGTSQ